MRVSLGTGKISRNPPDISSLLFRPPPLFIDQTTIVAAARNTKRRRRRGTRSGGDDEEGFCLAQPKTTAVGRGLGGCLHHQVLFPMAHEGERKGNHPLNTVTAPLPHGFRIFSGSNKLGFESYPTVVGRKIGLSGVRVCYICWHVRDLWSW